MIRVDKSYSWLMSSVKSILKVDERWSGLIRVDGS